MDDFVKKLIGRLEEVSYNHFDLKLSDAKEIVNQLAEEYNNSNDSMEIQIAKNYAKWLTKWGVNVTEKWLTATEQAYTLDKAYIRGRQDEMDKFAEWQNEHNNGWIPCSERLPEDYTEVLGYGLDGHIYMVTLYDTKIYGKVWKQWNGGEIRLKFIDA